jgi:PleD family two-component response regulator
MDQMSAKEHQIFLIVDPDSIARAQIRRFLADLGWNRVLEAERTKEALDFLDAKPIYGIIADWDTPAAGAFALMTLVRGEERFREILFIMTSKPDSETQTKIIKSASLKTDGFLLKPFLASNLDGVLKKIRKA